MTKPDIAAQWLQMPTIRPRAEIIKLVKAMREGNWLGCNRIGWLDSARMPAHIHLTNDKGETTLCGHAPNANAKTGRWVITPTVPRKRQGSSNYCKTCFKHGGKTLPFIE